MLSLCSASGESQWELPPWLDEIDPQTGATYYVSSITGDATWEKPPSFVPIIRENPFHSSAETDFVKSVLSPKRSKGAASFTAHLARTSTKSLLKGTHLSSSIYRLNQAASAAAAGGGGGSGNGGGIGGNVQGDTVEEGDGEGDGLASPRVVTVDYGE